MCSLLFINNDKLWLTPAVPWSSGPMFKSRWDLYFAYSFFVCLALCVPVIVRLLVRMDLACLANFVLPLEMDLASFVLPYPDGTKSFYSVFVRPVSVKSIMNIKYHIVLFTRRRVKVEYY